METAINWMYFANNYSHEQLAGLMEHMGQHLRLKYENTPGENGTQRLFKWFMQVNDKEKILTWVNNNYNYKTRIR
jgi:hypothetical protein